ncbi:hypothetical protein [Cochleicola gelatinilyticus]|uniref:TonB-dependent receptor plug domain-containing protein n=1 Tax=Cochleicola gelatinilyticus TaxID=1763537 RepID=A0A167HM15_9FLAO|nr:hypothetical protein [Cochleicola gelatinilyticus]OAB78757.1 hypothetical protein ULVI_09245 [Cochleicola gelatinilyticus]
MIRQLILIFFILVVCISSHAQSFPASELPSTNNVSFPSEEVFVHFNSTLLFAGEYLYYKVYVLKGKQRELSDFSKIGYVSLVDENFTTVFTHKLQLKKGIAQGDFFIPTELPSGNYKLVAYTNWMRNYDTDLFFQNTVTVINPYLGNQNALRATGLSETQINKPDIPIHTSRYLAIKNLQPVYKKREKVSFTLQSLKNIMGMSTYSVSVRKIDAIGHNPQTTFETFERISAIKNPLKNRSAAQSIYLPELRGELLTGRLISNNTGQSVAGKKISFSTPGNNYIAKVVTTNSKGDFIIQIEGPYTSSKGLIQLLEDDKEGYEIQINKPTSPKFTSLKFEKFALTPAMKDEIITRSVYNQIENAYFTVKPDTIRSLEQQTRFYEGREVINFTLDDYTRFRTMQETMIEIVDFAGIRTDSKGQDHFFVRPFEQSANSTLPPLVIVDGLVVPDHSLLSNYDPLKIEKISVIRDKYYYGSQVFQGIIEVTTIEGNFQLTDYKPYEKWVELDAPQPVKNYFKQHYSENDSSLDRIPDFRDQLLWMPNISITSEEKEITFYTSDNKGTYQITIEGISDSGFPVSIYETFIVE